MLKQWSMKLINYQAQTRRYKTKLFRNMKQQQNRKRNTPPVKERISTARIDNVCKKIYLRYKRLIEELPRQRTAMEIQRLFTNGIAYDVSKKPTR